MDGLASLLFPQAPSYAEGLLGAEEAQRLQSQAQRAGLLNIGLGLLAAGAPSPVRTGTGAGLVQGLMAGQEAYQRTYQQRLQEMEMMRKLQEQQRQQQMRQLAGSIIQPSVTPGAPAQISEESDGNVMIGRMPTAATTSIQIDPQRLAALAALSDNPLAALKAVGETVPMLRRAGLTTGGEAMANPFAPFLASENPNIKAIAEQYSRSFNSGVLDDTQIGRALESLGKMAEASVKPSSVRGDYEYAMAQRRERGEPTISFEQYQENLRRAGAASTTTTVFPPGAVAPGTSAQNKIDEALLSSGSRLQVLDRISQQYKPEFLQTKFRVSQGLVGLGEKLGREPTPEERQNLEQFSKFKQDAVRQLNQYINEITGAAIGQGEEAERLKSGVPNPGSGLFGGDSPTEFSAKLTNTIRDLRLAEARLQYIKSQGFKIQDVKLEDMPNIMRKRKEQIVKDFGLDENDPQAREVIKNRLASEFGLLR